MTTPISKTLTSGATVSNGAQRPAAPPPNPKQQAVTFALELAKIRATTGSVGSRTTDVDQLIADAEVIAKFMGQSQARGVPS